MGVYRERNPYTSRYRIVVYDDDREVWVVKHSGVTRKEAEELVSEYFDLGYTARMIIND